MTRTSRTQLIALVTAVSAVAGLALLTQGASASSNRVKMCSSSSLDNTMECCERLTGRRHSQFVLQGNNNCAESKSCSKTNKQRCFVILIRRPPNDVPGLIPLTHVKGVGDSGPDDGTQGADKGNEKSSNAPR